MTVRSLAAADSGITTMQTMIDTIGNNVANSNTDGYKQTTAEFSDVLTEQLTPSSAPIPGLASTNPSAIGSGDQLAAITTNFSEGAVVQTGVPSNAAIQGDGFFVVSRSGQNFYTRNGDFQLDKNGILETADGSEVQGWAAGQPTTGPTGPLTIPTGLTIAPQQSSSVSLGGNLPAGAPTTSPVTTTTTLYDSQGNTVPITVTLTPTGTAGQWNMTATDATNTPLLGGGVLVAFGANGQLSTVGGTAVSATAPTTVALTTPSAGTWKAGTAINLSFPAPGTNGAVTQFGGSASFGVTQNGYASGTLESYSIGQGGDITGTFSNGQSQTLGTIALATFTNPGGLADTGNLLYQTSAASGQPQVGAPGSGGRATILGGALEQSNVDLASQLTSLIEAQTDYQADTKVVSTTQTALQALVTNA
ncbi:MAG: protein of unknown function domain protein [Acidimicrobiaceae bacterium]|nr:protein of unknown function domain protein [Acidimicrobiaceae bacterium]